MCSTTQNPGSSAEERYGDAEYYFGGIGTENENCSGGGVLHETEGGVVKYSPDLAVVNGTLGWTFLLHAYGLACLFFFLAFYSFFSILNLRSQLSARPYMTTINSFLCLLGSTRAIVLFIDPYALKHALGLTLGDLLWDLGYPSLLSCFSLIQIAFLQLTEPVRQLKVCHTSPSQTDIDTTPTSPLRRPSTNTIFVVSQWTQKPLLMEEVGPDTLRKKTCLSVVITVHFASVIISAIYTNIYPDLMIGKQITQLMFTLWGLILCGSFLYSGRQQFLGTFGIGRGSSGEGSSAPATNEKGIANLFGMGLMGGGGGQNLSSSLTAALAPTLLQGGSSTAPRPGTAGTSASIVTASTSGQDTAPKIKVTDENDLLISGKPIQGSSKGDEAPGGPGSSTYVRPPSPVLPRRKSSGPGLRAGPFGSSPRRLSWNRNDPECPTNANVSNPSLSAPTPGPKEVRKKSLTWSELDNTERRPSRKSVDISGANNSDQDSRNGATESLLSASGGPDYTLQSILSHIAYVNQTALDYRQSRKLSRKNQVNKVVKFTSITALLGFILCLAELIRLLSPYGLLASNAKGAEPPVWPWFILQSIARLVEFGMGAAVANITKQPTNRPNHYAYSIGHKQRESLYL